jgi:hypothetical protein
MSTLLNSVNQFASSPPSSPPAVAAGGSEGERSEPERTAAATAGGRETPDPEVVGHPVRRRFTAAYKQRILAEVEAAAGTGAIGRILRREGLTLLR